MQSIKFVRNGVATWVALLAIVVPAAKATGQTPSIVGVKTVILIHGAWADGSSWSKVIPLLEAKGLHVVAVQIPLTSFADDVSATQRAIALEDGPVLLVGHSYGGAVITEAGNDPKVAGLVYVSAVAPDKGEPTSQTDSQGDCRGFCARPLRQRDLNVDRNAGANKRCCNEGRGHNSSMEVETVVVHRRRK